MTISNMEIKKISKSQVKDGVSRSVVYTQNLMTAIIDFTQGPWDEADPYHSHIHEQITYVAKGEIIFYCENQPDQHLKEGDVFAVPTGKKHTIKLLTKEARLVDSFTPIRGDFL